MYMYGRSTQGANLDETVSIKSKRLRWLAEKRRRMLWLGIVATLIPLVMMLLLQGWWLKRLHSSTHVVSQVTSDRFLEQVSSSSTKMYKALGWDLIRIAPELATGRRDTLTYLFHKYLEKTGEREEAWSEEALPYQKMGDKKKKEQVKKPRYEAQKPKPVRPDDPNVDLILQEYKISQYKNWPTNVESIFVHPFSGDYAGETFFFQPALRIGGPEPLNLDTLAYVDKAIARWEPAANTRILVTNSLFDVVGPQSPYPIYQSPIFSKDQKLVALVGFVVSAQVWQNRVLTSDVKDLSHMIEEHNWVFLLRNKRKEMVMEIASNSMTEERPVLKSSVPMGGPFKGYNLDVYLQTRSLKTSIKNWLSLNIQVPLAQKMFKRYLPSQKVMHFSMGDVQMINMAGTNIFINVILAMLLSGFILAGVVLVLRMAVRDLELSEMKSDFVSNVSHELRTPLASIRLFGELLRLGRVPNNEKVMEYGAYIEHEGRRLSRLINNILDFSKIESGQKLYHFQETDVSLLVRDAVETFRVRLSNTKQTMVFNEPEERLPLIPVDSDAFNQVLFNLIDNGIKYGKKDGTVAVSLKRNDGFIDISIRDDGIGIAKEELEKIFERFHRVSTGLVHDVKGSGLGLSIVKHVVSAHKGTVTVRSSLGKGSTFLIRLPITEGPELGEQSTPMEEFA